MGENIVHTIPYNRISDTMHVIKTEKMKTNENGTAKEQEKHIVREKLDKLPCQLGRESRGRGKLMPASAVSASKRGRGAAISGSWHKSWP